jgi:hypothetical protein
MKGIDRATYSCNRDSTRRSCNVLAEEGRLWSKIGAAALLTVKVFVAVVASCALVGIACWVNYDSAKDSGESLTAYAIASCILAAMSWIVVFSENVPLAHLCRGRRCVLYGSEPCEHHREHRQRE